MSRKFIPIKMKIFILILIILSIVFYASGCILLVQSNYNLSDYSDEFNFNEDSFKFNFNDTFLNFTNSYSSYDYDINNTISEIDFNMSSQNLKFITSKNNTLNIKINSFSSSSSKLNLITNNNRMTFSSTADISDDAEIIVNMPSDCLNKITLKITTSSGDIDIKGLSANAVNASSASGDVYFDKCNVNYLSCSSSSGDIYLNSINSYMETNLSSLSGSISGDGNFSVLTSKTSSGDMDISINNKLDNTFLASSSGDISLIIPSECDYNTNFSTLSGELTSSKNTLKNGDMSKTINVNTSSGNLCIDLI
ncbi:DUF4097 family beta strand repeat-containing protein [uncultured Clostridium sp.]|uniref:DUF4097 family beta strand repeat-containing protein n=1 Tax=uncultured Clostridium sp. TaxID=59620 RepID=UPI0025F50117|nr:DUF4097 family beta strand repeat-containing protein [uncultured Clostridium sp.]